MREKGRHGEKYAYYFLLPKRRMTPRLNSHQTPQGECRADYNGLLRLRETSVRPKECYGIARKHDKQVLVMEPVMSNALTKPPSSTKHILENIDEGVLVVLSSMSNFTRVAENTDIGLQAAERGRRMRPKREPKNMKRKLFSIIYGKIGRGLPFTTQRQAKATKRPVSTQRIKGAC